MINVAPNEAKTNCKASSEKILVTSADIVVTGTPEKPYYEIKYKEADSCIYKFGYGSYNLANVVKWLREFFIIPDADDSNNIANAKNGDLSFFLNIFELKEKIESSAISKVTTIVNSLTETAAKALLLMYISDKR